MGANLRLACWHGLLCFAENEKIHENRFACLENLDDPRLAVPPSVENRVGQAKFNITLLKNSRQREYNISYGKYEQERLDTTSQSRKRYLILKIKYKFNYQM